MKNFKNPFRFTSIFKPMVYLFIFSLAYGYGTLKLIELEQPWNNLLRSIWLALFGLGLYFICTLIWGKKRKTLALKKSGEVFLLCLVLAFFTAYVISPLALASGDALRLIAGAILGTVFLLFALPTLILIFRAIYEDCQTIPEQFAFVRTVWKKKFWFILNLWLLLFILMFLWDNVFGGPLYIRSGFDTPGLFTNVLFLKQPTVYFEMIWMLSASAAGTYELIMLGIIEAILEIFLECNIISWIGRASQEALDRDRPETEPSEPLISTQNDPDDPVHKKHDRSDRHKSMKKSVH